MEKQYRPNAAPVGLDSNLLRLIRRTANSVRISSSAPGWSSAWKATNVVRSAPVGGGGPGGATSTNRVTAPEVSSMSAASCTNWYRSAAIGAATAASASPAATDA